MMTKYSLCFIKYKYMTLAVFNPKDEDFSWEYYENFNEKKRKDSQNRTYCCFQKSLCDCFKPFKSDCVKATTIADPDNPNPDYCDCKKIGYDEGSCNIVSTCSFTKDDLEEKQDWASLGVVLLIAISLNYVCYHFCFYDVTEKGKRKNVPSASKRNRV